MEDTETSDATFEVNVILDNLTENQLDDISYFIGQLQLHGASCPVFDIVQKNEEEI